MPPWLGCAQLCARRARQRGGWRAEQRRVRAMAGCRGRSSLDGAPAEHPSRTADGDRANGFCIAVRHTRRMQSTTDRRSRMSSANSSPSRPTRRASTLRAFVERPGQDRRELSVSPAHEAVRDLGGFMDSAFRRSADLCCPGTTLPGGESPSASAGSSAAVRPRRRIKRGHRLQQSAVASETILHDAGLVEGG